jgi:hypothetical protein
MPERFARAQFDLLREIFELARRQRGCLERDEFDGFRALMDQRDDLVAQMQTLGVAPEEVPENVIAFPSRSEEAVQDRLALDTLIRGILEHDAQNERLLREKMNQVRQQLPGLQAGRRATAAYRVEPPGAAYVDRAS